MSLVTISFLSNSYFSYASIAEAGAVNNADPVRRVAWGDLADDDRKVYLIAATQRLDLLRWRGERTAGALQATAWPREGLRYSEDDTDVPDNVIPVAVERATALLAGSIAITPAQADQGATAQDIAEIRAGSVTIRRFQQTVPSMSQSLQDETAYELVRQWVETGPAVIAGAAYGTGTPSSFADIRRYDYQRTP